jgi:hypothetical protein
MKNGIKPLVEVVMNMGIPFNRPQMVDISLRVIQRLVDLVGVMFG